MKQTFTLEKMIISSLKLTFILVRDVGQAFIARDVPADSIRAFLATELMLAKATS